MNRCFPSLQRLFYENGGAENGLEGLLPQYFGRVISHLHDSLYDLTFLNRDYHDSGLEEVGLLGSFTAFRRLRKIITYESELLKPDP
jgi:hypothetical protein